MDLSGLLSPNERDEAKCLEHILSELSLIQADTANVYNSKVGQQLTFSPEIRVNIYEHILSRLNTVTACVEVCAVEAAAEYRVRNVYGINNV